MCIFILTGWGVGIVSRNQNTLKTEKLGANVYCQWADLLEVTFNVIFNAPVLPKAYAWCCEFVRVRPYFLQCCSPLLPTSPCCWPVRISPCSATPAEACMIQNNSQSGSVDPKKEAQAHSGVGQHGKGPGQTMTLGLFAQGQCFSCRVEACWWAIQNVLNTQNSVEQEPAVPSLVH